MMATISAWWTRPTTSLRRIGSPDRLRQVGDRSTPPPLSAVSGEKVGSWFRDRLSPMTNAPEMKDSRSIQRMRAGTSHVVRPKGFEPLTF